MDFDQEDLNWAVSQGILTKDQAEAFLSALTKRHQDRPRFDLSHVAYYLGALVVISAMGWFMTTAIEALGGILIALIASTYAVAFIAVGWILWNKKGLRTPGGLLYTVAVCMTPLIIYGLEKAAGEWPAGIEYYEFHRQISSNWLFMEIGTIAAGLMLLYYVRFPFLVAPIIFFSWYLFTMDGPEAIVGTNISWDERLWFSVVFGLALIAIAFRLDRRSKPDFSFWIYFFGVASFWGGLSLMNSGSELNKLLYALINIGLVLCAVLLNRPVFLIFGVLGFFGYLAHLAYSVFANSMLFPVALSALGILLIVFGVYRKKNHERIETWLRSLVPNGLLRHLPSKEL